MHQSYNYMQKTTGSLSHNFHLLEALNFVETLIISDIFK